MGYLCETDKPLVLSSSGIGNIARCACCNCYHLCVGHVTLRLEHKYMLTLAQMLIEALEVSTAVEHRTNGHISDQA